MDVLLGPSEVSQLTHTIEVSLAQWEAVGFMPDEELATTLQEVMMLPEPVQGRLRAAAERLRIQVDPSPPRDNGSSSATTTVPGATPSLGAATGHAGPWEGGTQPAAMCAAAPPPLAMGVSALASVALPLPAPRVLGTSEASTSASPAVPLSKLAVPLAAGEASATAALSAHGGPPSHYGPLACCSGTVGVAVFCGDQLQSPQDQQQQQAPHASRFPWSTLAAGEWPRATESVGADVDANVAVGTHAHGGVAPACPTHTPAPSSALPGRDGALDGARTGPVGAVDRTPTIPLQWQRFACELCGGVYDTRDGLAAHVAAGGCDDWLVDEDFDMLLTNLQPPSGGDVQRECPVCERLVPAVGYDAHFGACQDAVLLESEVLGGMGDGAAGAFFTASPELLPMSVRAGAKVMATGTGTGTAVLDEECSNDSFLLTQGAGGGGCGGVGGAPLVPSVGAPLEALSQDILAAARDNAGRKRRWDEVESASASAAVHPAAVERLRAIGRPSNEIPEEAAGSHGSDRASASVDAPAATSAAAPDAEPHPRVMDVECNRATDGMTSARAAAAVTAHAPAATNVAASAGAARSDSPTVSAKEPPPEVAASPVEPPVGKKVKKERVERADNAQGSSMVSSSPANGVGHAAAGASPSPPPAPPAPPLTGKAAAKARAAEERRLGAPPIPKAPVKYPLHVMSGNVDRRKLGMAAASMRFKIEAHLPPRYELRRMPFMCALHPVPEYSDDEASDDGMQPQAAKPKRGRAAKPALKPGYYSHAKEASGCRCVTFNYTPQPGERLMLLCADYASFAPESWLERLTTDNAYEQDMLISVDGTRVPTPQNYRILNSNTKDVRHYTYIPADLSEALNDGGWAAGGKSLAAWRNRTGSSSSNARKTPGRGRPEEATAAAVAADGGGVGGLFNAGRSNAALPAMEDEHYLCVQFPKGTGQWRMCLVGVVVTERSVAAMCDEVRARWPAGAAGCGVGGGSQGELLESVTLRCPLTFAKMRLPARGLTCAHPECFDLAAFLDVSLSRNIWGCPVCNAALPFHELVVDPILHHVVDTSPPDVHQVWLRGDGSWTPVTDPTAAQNAVGDRDVIELD